MLCACICGLNDGDAAAENNQGVSVAQDINAELVDASNRENAYSNYVKKHKDDPRPDHEILIDGKDFVSADNGAEVEVASVDGKDNVAK